MQFGKEESEDRLEPATVARERYGALGSFMPFLDFLEPSEVNFQERSCKGLGEKVKKLPVA